MKRLLSSLIVALMGVLSCNSPAPAQDQWKNEEFMNFSNECYGYLLYNEETNLSDELKPWEVRQMCNCTANELEQMFSYELAREYMSNPPDPFLDLVYNIGARCFQTIKRGRGE